MAKVASHGAVQGESPPDYALAPLIILQICLVLDRRHTRPRAPTSSARSGAQPRVIIAEIIHVAFDRAVDAARRPAQPAAGRDPSWSVGAGPERQVPGERRLPAGA